MATKDYCLSLNKKVFCEEKISNDQYRNLNLNQNQQNLSTAENHVHSKHFKIDRKSCVQNYDLNDKSEARKNSNLWKNKFGKSSLNYSDIRHSDSKNDSKRGTSSNVKINSSTLSLHITAYENSITKNETSNNSIGDNNDCLKMKNANLLASTHSTTSNFQNSFEFHRQQMNDDVKSEEPEMMQFKASQKLLNPREKEKQIQKGRGRFQAILSKLRMFNGSGVSLDIFVAEYEKHFDTQLSNDLQKYFGNENFIFVLGNHFSDLVSFHYTMNENQKFFGKCFIRALHDFQLSKGPPQKMTFSVIESSFFGHEKPQKKIGHHSRRAKEYTNAVGGYYTSDENEDD